MYGASGLPMTCSYSRFSITTTTTREKRAGLAEPSADSCAEADGRTDPLDDGVSVEVGGRSVVPVETQDVARSARAIRRRARWARRMSAILDARRARRPRNASCRPKCQANATVHH